MNKVNVWKSYLHIYYVTDIFNDVKTIKKTIAKFQWTNFYV